MQQKQNDEPVKVIYNESQFSTEFSNLFLTVTNRNWSEDGISLIIKVAFVAVVDHIANINTMMKRVSAFHRASTRLTKLYLQQLRMTVFNAMTLWIYQYRSL